MTTLGSLLQGVRATACASASSLLVLSFAAHAQVATSWTFSTPGATAVGSAVDAYDNVLAAGTSAAPAMLVTKVSRDGLPLWQQAFDGVGASRTVAMATDSAGSVIVAGYALGADGLTPSGTVVVKYDANGVQLWQEVVPASWGMPAAVQVDAVGNVYLLSRMAVAGTVNTEEDILAKLSGIDGSRAWSRTLSTRLPGLQPLAVTSNGMVVVSGSTAITGQAGLTAFDAAGNLVWSSTLASNSDVALATGPSGELVVAGSNASGFQVNKYDALFNGLWFQTIPARGAATRVAVDTLGNIVLSGPVNAATGLLTVMLYDWLTVKLSPQGTLLWSAGWGDPITNDVPNALALGADGSVNVTGLGTLAVTSASGFTSTVGSTVTLKYDASGKLLWTGNVLASSQGLGVSSGSDGATYVVAGGLVGLGGAPQTVLKYPTPVVVNAAPVAVASASTSAGTAPLAVSFASTGSSDPDGTIASYQWNFGDGTGSTLANPSHSYAAGSYSVTLTVTDNGGASATSAPIALKVNAPATLQAPAQPATLSLAAASVVGGTTTTGTVALTSGSGATVRLRTSSTKAVVPTSITVPAGAKSGSFSITTKRVSSTTPVIVYATANGVTIKSTLTLTR